MAILSSPVTGGSQTGLTSPTYTLIVDGVPPRKGAAQYVVSALGGTQSGVDVNSIAKPFTVTVMRPETYRSPVVNSSGNVVGTVPRNTHKVLVRKGVDVDSAGARKEPLTIDISINVPAGAEAYDPENIRAAISLAVGSLNQYSSGLGDQVVSGIMPAQ